MNFGVGKQKEMKCNFGLDKEVEVIFQDSQTRF